MVLFCFVFFFRPLTDLPPQLATLGSLTPDQKAQLILDPSSGALQNVTVFRQVFVSITTSPAEGQLDDFFAAFVATQVSVMLGRSKLTKKKQDLTGQWYWA